MTTRKFAFRIRESDYQVLKSKAKPGKVTMTSLIVSAVTGKEIVVIDNLKNFLSELKAIGRNLNQLTTLANMGKVNTVYLSETKQELNKLYEILSAMAEMNMGSPQSLCLCGEKEHPRSGEPFSAKGGESDKRRAVRRGDG